MAWLGLTGPLFGPFQQSASWHNISRVLRLGWHAGWHNRKPASLQEFFVLLKP
jgi:hypothetical protein